MIVNIGSKLDLIQEYLEEQVGDLFDVISAGKPSIQPAGFYLWFEMSRNTPKISSDNKGMIYKEALFDFYLISNDKTTPDVVMYEKLDELSNKIRTYNKSQINLNDFIIINIEEGNQSGVMKDTKENPMIIAQYRMTYQYLY